MRLLVDTHLLIWAHRHPHRLSATARSTLLDPLNTLYFSAASIWEVAIKQAALRGAMFDVDPSLLLHDLSGAAYVELPVLSRHTLAVPTLQTLHKDPFDRLLLAQAVVEGMILLTSDEILGRSKGPVRKV